MSITEITINSKFRDTGDSHNFSINIPNLPVADYKSIVVRSLTIPQTFYYVNSNYNTLDWKTSNGTDVTTTVTPGNYTLAGFISALETAINTTATAASDTNTYTVVQNTVTSKITISGDLLNFEIHFSDSTMNDILGYNNTNVTGALSYAATGTPNIKAGQKIIFVESDIKTVNDHYVPGSGEYSYLTSIATANYGDILTLEDVDIRRPVGSIRNFTRARFSLRDENYNLVDLNGNDWILQLVLL